MALSLPWTPSLVPLPPDRQLGSQKYWSHDCLKLAPLSVNVVDSLTHQSGRSKAFFIPQSRRVKGNNSEIIPSKVPGGKSHHMLSPAVLWTLLSGALFLTLVCSGSTDPLEII